MTLSDRINKRWCSDKPGRCTELTKEEDSLAYYINYMASINHPLSVTAVKAFAWNLVKQSSRLNRFNSETGPGHTWYQKFKKRHDLTNRKPDNIDRGRSRMANKTVIDQHFTLLGDTLHQLGLTENP